ncbi:YwqJ-related putative deaminase [Amycolatopsis sp.]|uniref:YwqJ-related putative deaminase n=1 Tax=Amycolatopsis sp. TaxID=37632 RepID=UPI002D1D2038|nr:YwqJ-related putative deaminase [Amycolatopsis sp.]HVV14616.1 YwqJ-related putative deaminase [Amycolatopsis sp.]
MPGKGFHLNTPDLRKTGSDLNTFSDRLSGHSSRLETLHTKVSSNTRKDKSGLGSLIGKFTDKAGGVFKKFLGESSRVTGQSGKNLHKGADAMDKTEQDHVASIKKLHSDTKVPSKLETIEEGKAVRFDDSAKKHDGGSTYKPPKVNTATNPAKTGDGTHHLAGDPQTGTHPLKTGLDENDTPNMTKVSHQQGQDIGAGFSNKTRPGMASSLQTGDTTTAHSSMKGGTPNRHPLVQNLLDELATRDDQGNVHETGVGPAGKGHGQCAEVGAISDYLHKVDPNGTWSVQDARNHFEQVGGATVAHQPSSKKNPDPVETPPCVSCSYMTHKLGINAMSPQTVHNPETGKDDLMHFPWDNRSETPGKINVV